MPYKSEKINYPRELDKRIKLTDTDRETIKNLSKQGGSLRGIAKMFGVDKATIRNVIKPELYKEQLKKYSLEKHSQKYYNKEKHALYMKRYRQRKQALYLKGIIKLDK